MENVYLNLKNTVIQFEAFLRSEFDPKNPASIFEFKSSDDDMFKKVGIYEKLRLQLSKVKEPVNEDEGLIVNMCLIQLQLLNFADELILAKKDKRFAKNLRIATVRYNAALSGRDPSGAYSTAMDLDSLIWIRNCPANILEFLVKNGKFKGKLIQKSDSPYYGLQKSLLRYGTMMLYMQLKTAPEARGLDLLANKTNPVMLNRFLSNAQVQILINTYLKSEKFWLESAVSEEEEIKSRLVFMNAYHDTLQNLYAVMCMTKTQYEEIQDVILDYIKKGGIYELVKDFVAVNYAITAENDFIYKDSNYIASEYRNNLTEYFQESADWLTKNPYLKEFHRFIFQRLGSGSTLFTSRPYIESLLVLPDNEQLKLLYVIENNLVHSSEIITDETVSDYTPDIRHISEILEYSQWKYFISNRKKRINWELIKNTADKLEYDKSKGYVGSGTADIDLTPEKSDDFSAARYLGLYYTGRFPSYAVFKESLDEINPNEAGTHFNLNKINEVNGLFKTIMHDIDPKKIIYNGRQEIMNAQESTMEPIYKYFPNYKKVADAMHIVDEVIFSDEDYKEQALSDVYDLLDLKYRRLPDSLREKYSSDMSKILWNNDKLTDLIRTYKSAEAGELTIHSAANKILHAKDSDEIITTKGILSLKED